MRRDIEHYTMLISPRPAAILLYLNSLRRLQHLATLEVPPPYWLFLGLSTALFCFLRAFLASTLRGFSKLCRLASFSADIALSRVHSFSTFLIFAT